MKKFLTIAISAIFAMLMCVGCSTETVTTPSIDDPLPWVAYRTFESETSTYKVTKSYMNDENNPTTVNDEENSFMTYSLTKYVDEQNNSLCKLETNFKIVYTNSDYLADNYKNKTDEITSVAVFRTDNLATVKSSKTVSLQSNPSASYSFEANYESGETTFVVNGNATTLSFSKGNYIDNEFLYYYVRSMKNLGDSLNESFAIVNWYECYLKGEFATTDMIASYYTAEGVILGNASLLDGFSSDSKDTETSTVKCNLIQILLADSNKQGSPLYVYFTQSPYSIESNKTAKKLIAKVRTYENTTSGIVTFRTDYTLSGFSATFKTASSEQ